MRPGWLLTGWLLLAVLLVFAPAPCRADAPQEHPGKKDEGGKKEGAGTDENEAKEIEGERPNIFKGFIDLSIWTIVIFLVLLFVLKKYAWGPMLEGLENREKNIHGQLEQAQKANADAQALKADFERQISQAHEQARTVVEEARATAKAMTVDMVNEAKAEIQTERDRLRRELDTAREQALLELWRRSTQLASLVSSKAIRRQLTIEDQHRLVDEALNDLGVAAHDRQAVLASVQ